MMIAHATQSAAQALIRNFTGKDPTRAELHQAAEELYPSHPVTERRTMVRAAWAALHPRKEASVPKRKIRGSPPGFRKVYDPMPEGMRGPNGLTTVQRDKFRAWIMSYIRDNPEEKATKIRDLLADRSGVWYGDIEGFTRNYINPIREHLGLDAEDITKHVRDPGAVHVPPVVVEDMLMLEPSKEKPGFSRVTIELDLPHAHALRVMHMVTGAMIPKESE